MARLKLTEGLKTEICCSIRDGLTKKTAADAAGIAETTFYSWLRQGEKDLDAGKSTKYALFLQSVKQAEAEHKRGRLAVIHKAAQDGSWQAAAWELERRYRSEYGKATVDVNLAGQPGGEPIKTESAVQIYLPANGRDGT